MRNIKILVGCALVALAGAVFAALGLEAARDPALPPRAAKTNPAAARAADRAYETAERLK